MDDRDMRYHPLALPGVAEALDNIILVQVLERIAPFAAQIEDLKRRVTRLEAANQQVREQVVRGRPKNPR